ncbi:MAG: GNAT family N-acetyltransferase [Paracoccaceae bacterium]
MSANILKTERLILRPMAMTDAPDISRLIGTLDVSRWLEVVPYPYALTDAESFISDQPSDWRFTIEIDGAVAGVISISDQLGYWLGKPFWNHGYMTEAAIALVGEWFQRGANDLNSGYFVANARSSSVLHKLGFKATERTEVYSLAQNKDVALQRMHLTRADWQAYRG